MHRKRFPVGHAPMPRNFYVSSCSDHFHPFTWTVSSFHSKKIAHQPSCRICRQYPKQSEGCLVPFHYPQRMIEHNYGNRRLFYYGFRPACPSVNTHTICLPCLFHRTNHGNFIAVGEFAAVDAIFPHFLRQALFRHFMKTCLSKKYRLIRQRK